MIQPPPFDVISGLRRTSHGVIALALAAEFDDDVDLAAVEQALLDLSSGLRGIARVRDENQLALVGDVLGHQLRVAGEHASTRLDDLLFHRVAVTRRGQALVCGLVAIEAARIAGIPLGIVATRTAVYLGHCRAASPVVLVPRHDWLPADVRDLGEPDLAWPCPHESAGMLLGMVLARAHRTGMLSTELRAAELCLALPVAEDERHRLHMQLARVRARLN